MAEILICIYTLVTTFHIELVIGDICQHVSVYIYVCVPHFYDLSAFIGGYK